MPKVKIMTDSGCDISKEEELRYNIDIMSFEIVLGDETIYERVDMTNHEFYDKIDKSDFIPKTSQITVFRFEEQFEKYALEEYDHVICVLINSTGSRTYDNAVQAEKELRESGKLGKTKIHVVDSHCYSIGYGYAVIEGARKLESGHSVNMVLAFMEDWFNGCEIYIIGFNLRHMKKSGRINAAAAFLGEMLQLKPVISLIDGESVVVKKSRGERAAITDAIEYINKRAIPETPWHVLTTTATEQEKDFIERMTKARGSAPMFIEECGGVVASNAGTKFIGIVVKGMPRR